MVNVEDVGKQLIIIKKRHVQVVDFQQLLWEDLMDGVKSLELEEVKEPVEWDIKKIFQEELKMDLEVELHPNQLKERLNDLIL